MPYCGLGARLRTSANMAEGTNIVEQRPAKPPATPIPKALTVDDVRELTNELKSVSDWHSLGIKLGLKPHHLTNIETNHRGNDLRCKTEMLSCWILYCTPPSACTWEAVAQALDQMDQCQVADQIRKKHISSTTTIEGPSLTTKLKSLSATCRWRPFVAIGQCSVQKINGKFSKLVTESCRRIQRKKISVKDFQLFLVTMCSSCDSRDMVTAEIKPAKSLDDIFLALSKNGFWDYLNYYPLQSVIDQFASDDNELRGMMKQYQKDLSGHILALEIQGCLYFDATNQVQISLAFPPPASVTDHSLSYVKDLWQSLENQFALPQLEMILHNTAKSVLPYQPHYRDSQALSTGFSTEV